MDVLTPEQRSYCMSQIKSKNTKPELALRKALWALGYRYRVKNQLPGKPDIIFPRKKVAIFVDGCFWHKCPEHFVQPKSRKNFWMEKIEINCRRDIKVNSQLDKMGWTVIRFWEHEIKENLESCISHFIKTHNSC